MADSTDKGQVAHEAVKLWRGEPGSLRYVSDSENYVCSFAAPSGKLYLRLTSPSRRTIEQVEAEIDFVRHLHGGGASVSPPVVSANGRYVEPAGGADLPLLACVFEEARGEPFSPGAYESDREHFRLRGRTLGRIHALSKLYAPAGRARRFRWDEDALLRDMRRYLPDSEEVAWAEYRLLSERLRAYPETKESFGLIHGDFGAANLRCAKDLLSVFDFDDCCYHWYVYDLAVSIYPHGSRPCARGLLDAMIEGYSEETDSDARLINDIAVFCRLRLLYMFLAYARKWGFTDLSAEQAQWFSRKRESMARRYVLRE